jgi:hypothetical protein
MIEVAAPSKPANAGLTERLKRMGYAPSQKIRLYGQEYEVISDPFMEGSSVAILVRKNHEIRTLRLPSTVVRKALANSRS